MVAVEVEDRKVIIVAKARALSSRVLYKEKTSLSDKFTNHRTQTVWEGQAEWEMVLEDH